MDGIERITEKILQDAQAQVQQLQSQTEQQARQLMEQAQQEGRQEADAILARGRKAAQERLERLSSAAQMEARKLTLQAKQEMLTQAFELALERLCSLPRLEYAALLGKLLARWSATGKEQVIFSPADREQVGAQAIEAAHRAGAQGLTLSDQTRPIRGGFILADGNVELNCAFETLVRLQREPLEKQVAQVLFQEQ